MNNVESKTRLRRAANGKWNLKMQVRHLPYQEVPELGLTKKIVDV